VSKATESLYYVHTPQSENILDMFSVNDVPFLFYDYGTGMFVINGRVTDGTRELGQEEVDYYRERSRGFQARLRGTTTEMIQLTNSTAITKSKSLGCWGMGSSAIGALRSNAHLLRFARLTPVYISLVRTPMLSAPNLPKGHSSQYQSPTSSSF
ncbi:hypothetical protein chiPu_0023224, partial [Chiloscyllium punctatum]|nr:hypothetical protein [Chiloscyllium punctatum]